MSIQLGGRWGQSGSGTPTLIDRPFLLLESNGSESDSQSSRSMGEESLVSRSVLVEVLLQVVQVTGVVMSLSRTVATYLNPAQFEFNGEPTWGTILLAIQFRRIPTSWFDRLINLGLIAGLAVITPSGVYFAGGFVSLASLSTLLFCFTCLSSAGSQRLLAKERC